MPKRSSVIDVVSHFDPVYLFFQPFPVNPIVGGSEFNGILDTVTGISQPRTLPSSLKTLSIFSFVFFPFSHCVCVRE